MTIREQKERDEYQRLSPYAQKSAQSIGRVRPLEPCSLRTCYERDRDRIIHSKSYRRLKHKTQVFLFPRGDHYRTRLTHTMEVTQVARVLARALRLNEDLVEAIALGHDLGHAPFGHLGEAVLDELMDGGFDHAWQSRRTVELLEGEGGLNLCYEVRDGIENHNSKKNPKTLEARLVHFADRTAYVNHDIDDAIRSGLITLEDIPQCIIQTLGETASRRIDCVVRDIVQMSFGKDTVMMSVPVASAMEKLRNFLFENVYLSAQHNKDVEDKKAKDVVRRLFYYFCENVEAMPQQFIGIARREGVQRGVCDFIAGMTDRYALSTYIDVFVPDAWELQGERYGRTY